MGAGFPDARRRTDRTPITACMLRNEPSLLLPVLTKVMPARGLVGRMLEQKPSGVQQASFHVDMHVGEGGSVHSQLGFEPVACVVAGRRIAGVVASHYEVRAVRLLIAAGQT